MKTAKQLLEHAEYLREHESPDACLAAIDEARNAAMQEKDYVTFVHLLCTEAIAHKLNFQRSGNQKDLASMMWAGKAMLVAAEKYELPGKIGTANFIIAGAHREKQEWRQSLPYYTAAVKFCEEHEAERADWKRHLGSALIFAGSRVKGEKIFWQALGELDKYQDTYQADDKLTYKIAVWRSGGYMDAVEIYWSEDNWQALTHLHTAEKIIERYNLAERRRQLAAFKKRLGIAA